MKTYKSSKRGSQIDSAVEYIQETLPQALEDINNVIEELSEDVGSISGDVTVIQNKIPNQATSDNQLADKEFVNSSISTETAHYISNNGLPFESEAQLRAYQGTVTNNDYAFVTGTEIEHGTQFYDRYKATVTVENNVETVVWAKEWRINNTGFTAAQWSAIMSGITSALVNQITENQQAILTMAQSIANKVDKEQGKGLSTEDYTTAEKDKLDDIETGAEVNDVVGVQQNGEDAVDENTKIAHIDAYKKEDALSIMCPQTETTSLVISDAISHNVIDYTIYGNTRGVGDEVTIEGQTKYRIPITVRGKNLFDISKNTQGFVNSTYNDLYNTYNDDHTVLTTNTSSQQGRSGRFSLGTFDAGTYYVSVVFKDKNRVRSLFVTKNGVVVGTATSPCAITLTEPTEVLLYYSFTSSNNPYTLSEVQIEKGSSGTPYKPYFERTVNIYLDSPLSEGQSVSLSETNVPFMLDGNDINTITFGTKVQPSSVKIKYYQDINQFGGVSGVSSVNGRTGAVTLVKSDVGLGNVDNTADTDKPISTATQTALDAKASASDVTTIQSKIPNQATSENQLADKNFVNSSISTETAHYISDNGEPFTDVEDLPTDNSVTNNDYAFVTGTDSAGNTYYDKYKATVSGNAVAWAKEYRLNNSSFTAAQWAAISSGITSALVSKISANETAIENKLTEPSSGIAVGKYFRVASIDNDGHAVLECVDAPTAPVQSVSAAGTALTPDANGNVNIPQIDVLNDIYKGLVNLGNSGSSNQRGLWVDSAGRLYVSSATDQPMIYDVRRDWGAGFKNFIYPGVIDYAVKRAMTDGVGSAWTDAERLAALLRMGCTVDENGFVKWTATPSAE